MSFRCGRCGVQRWLKPERVVVETRDKVYPMRFGGNECVDNGGRGWEIVREEELCKVCVRKK